MKKAYETPALYIERFDLTQSIASGCSVLETFGGTTVNNTSSSTCGIVFGGTAFFGDGVQGCLAGEYDEFCYNAPSEGAILFAS